MNSQRILELRISNVLRIKSVAIKPDGNLIVIGGDNEQGKSSVLKFIWMALGGKDAIPEEPLRRGTSKGGGTLILDDLIVTLTFNRGGEPRLKVMARKEGGDGATLSSPQSILNALFKKTIDPLAFTRLRPEKQAETLRALVGLDFTALERKKKSLYDERTLVNREADVLKGKLDGFEIDESAPDEEVNIMGLMDKLKAIRDKNEQNRKHRLAANNAKLLLNSDNIDLERADAVIADLEERLEVAQDKAVEIKKRIEVRQSEIGKLDEFAATLVDGDETPINDDIAALDETNTKVRSKRRFRELQKELAGKQGKSQQLTDAIQAIDDDKEKQLREAKFPLQGLSFTENGVTLKGLPFSQASDSEQLLASLAIATALQPTLRVMTIREGALLDQNRMKLLNDWAEKNSMQVWVERVGRNDPGAVIMEDGEAKQETEKQS